MMPNSARIAPFEGKNTILPLVDNSKSEDKHLQVKIKKKKKKRRRQQIGDPRWDVKGFLDWAKSGEIAWVRVGYLRELESSGTPWARRSEIPPEALIVGEPPASTHLYAVSQQQGHHQLSEVWHSDCDGERLKKVVHILNEDGASDDDLVFEWYMSCYHHGNVPTPAIVQRAGTDILYSEASIPAVDVVFEGDEAVSRVPKYLLCEDIRDEEGNLVPFGEMKEGMQVVAYRPLTEREKNIYDKLQCAGSDYIILYHRIHHIIIDTPVNHSIATDQVGYFQHAWTCAHDLHFTSYAQHIVNHADGGIFQKVTPNELFGLAEKIRNNELWTENPSKDLEHLMRRRRNLESKMLPARSDAIGFRCMCRHARLRWVKVSFLLKLEERGGPPPRYQDLPCDSFVEGEPTVSAQPFVLSYSWSSSKHPSPSGQKIRELVQVLNRFDAKETDLVFMDWMSLPQAAPQDGMPTIYFEVNDLAMGEDGDTPTEETPGLIQVQDRTNEESRRFQYALRETTRLFGFAGGTIKSATGDVEEVPGCKVIVLPKVDDVKSFPGLVEEGEVTEKRLNEECDPPREEKMSIWGWIKSIPYSQSGWACSEYSVARHNGTIVNMKDKNVRAIEHARDWPNDAVEFAAMLELREITELSTFDLSAHHSHTTRHRYLPVHFSKKGDREVLHLAFFKHAYMIGQGHEVSTFEIRGKLYKYMETMLEDVGGHREWVEYSAGFLKIMRNRESQAQRLALQDQTTRKVVMVTALECNMPVTKMDTSDVSVVWTTQDAENDVLAFKCASVGKADELISAIKEAINSSENFVAFQGNGADGRISGFGDGDRQEILPGTDRGAVEMSPSLGEALGSAEQRSQKADSAGDTQTSRLL